MAERVGDSDGVAVGVPVPLIVGVLVGPEVFVRVGDGDGETEVAVREGVEEGDVVRVRVGVCVVEGEVVREGVGVDVDVPVRVGEVGVAVHGAGVTASPTGLVAQGTVGTPLAMAATHSNARAAPTETKRFGTLG